MTSDKLTLILLYAIFIIYILQHAFSSLFILGHLVIIVVVILFYKRGLLLLQYNSIYIILLSLLLINIVISYFTGFNGREIIFLFQVILTYWILFDAHLSIKQFIKYLNSTYLLFSIISFMVYYEFIAPLTFGDFGVFNWFYIDSVVNKYSVFQPLANYIPILHSKTYVGINGSTSSIDSYSALVLLLNVLFNDRLKSKLVFSSLASVQLLAAFRITPYVGIVFGLVSIIIPQKFRRLYFGFILVFSAISWLIPYLMTNNFEVFIFDKMTHGRAGIWVRYVEIILKSTWSEIIYGIRGNIPFININGRWIDQPHSTYLRMFLSFGLGMYGIIFFILYKIGISLSNVKSIAIYISIIVFGIVNNDILYNYNCIYYITVIVLYRHEKSHKVFRGSSYYL